MHTPTVDVSQDQPTLPNQHFSPWLRGQTTLFISQISAILGFVLFLASLVYYVSHLGEPSRFLRPVVVKLIVDYAHVVFMAVFILVLIQVLDDNQRGSYRVKLVYQRVFGKHRGAYKRDLEAAEDQLKKFKHNFLWFWIGMLFLYVFFACQHSYQLATSEPIQPSVHSTSLSFSTVKKGSDGKEERFKTEVSYATTDNATEASHEQSGLSPAFQARTHYATDPNSELLSRSAAFKKLAFPLIVFFFNNVTLLFIFWCFLVLYIPSDEMPKKYHKYRNGSGIIIGGLTLLFPLFIWIKGEGTLAEWKDFAAVFDALSGVTNAIVLALLVARLDSKLIGLPSWLISILYSYAAVQPLFMVFELSQSQVLEKIATSVLIFVFVSKIYFFLIIIYALQTGKMLNYMFCFPVLRKRAIHENPREKPATIDEWLRSDRALKTSMWLGSAAICYFVVSLLSSVIPIGGNGDGSMRDVIVESASRILRPQNEIIDCAQLIVVVLMVRTIVLVWNKNDYGDSGARAMALDVFRAQHMFEEDLNHSYSRMKGKMQLKKFKKYFLYFWLATFVLYIVLFLDHQKIILFSGIAYSLNFTLQILLYPFLEFALGTVNLLFIFWCFVVLQSPAFDKRANKRQNLLVNYSLFLVSLLIAAFPLLLFVIGAPKLSESNMRDYATIYDGVTGTLSAVGLALLIARMDSKLFGLNSWLIGILFAYASIQPLFVAFALNVAVLEMIQTSVLTAALGLKICFFLIIMHSLQSGRVINYLACFPFLKERVDSIFENQFEFRLVPTGAESDPFTVLILKKNELRYSTPKRFKSRAECDTFVRHVCKRMEGDYFKPESESGTHWVELRSDQLNEAKINEMICESLPLRSEEEALELIRESREKVPHCKYNRT